MYGVWCITLVILNIHAILAVPIRRSVLGTDWPARSIDSWHALVGRSDIGDADSERCGYM